MDGSSTDILSEGTLSLASRLLDLEETVARADRARSANTIMLDVRHPLSVIMIDCGTGLRCLGEQRPNLEKIQAILERLLSSAERADAIVQEFDDSVVSHFPRCETLSLKQLACSAIERVEHQLVSRRVTIASKMPPEELNVLGDRTQLVQALVNLLMFAVCRAEVDVGLRLEVRAKNGMQVVRLDWQSNSRRESLFGNDRIIKDWDTDNSVSTAIAEAHGGYVVIGSNMLEMWLPPKDGTFGTATANVIEIDPTKEH